MSNEPDAELVTDPAANAGLPGSHRTLTRSFRALRHRNYRIYFLGQSVSLTGSWMQQVAMGWLVYRLTGSPLMLGVVGFAGQIPALVVAPIAGVLLDRWDRHRVVLVGQVCFLVQAALLAGLVLSSAVQVWQIVVLAAMLGTISGFDIPARQAFIVRLVGPADLPNAIALNSSLFNAARLVGPAIAGLLIAVVGEGVIFTLNAVSYVAVLAALLSLDVARTPVTGAGAPILRTLADGVRYALKSSPIRTILALLAVTSLAGVPYVILLPVFATDVLGGGSHTYGFLMSAAGLGALAGGLFLAGRATVRGLGRVIATCALVFGVALMCFALSRNEWLSMVALFAAGFGIMAQAAAMNTVLQTIVDEDKRGRVMSFYTMAFMGTVPIGSLAAGAVAARIGAPLTVLIGGFVCICGALWFASRLPALRDAVRPIYLRLGILPELARGMHAATEELRRR